MKTSLLSSLVLVGTAILGRGQAVDVTATLDSGSVPAGGATVLRVFARVTPAQQAGADRIFSWYVDVLNTNAATATLDFGGLQKPTSDQYPQTSSAGTADGSNRRGIYDTFLNLPGAGVSAPVQLMVIPVNALAPGQARFQIRPGTGADLSADFLVAPLGGGAPLTGGNYSLAEAVLTVSGSAPGIPVSIAVTRSGTGTNSVTLRFPITAGFNFTAQFRDQLNGGTGWQPLPGAPHNTGVAMDASALGRRFYRVSVTPAN